MQPNKPIRMAIYKVQHNGKGKSHLLNANLEILCGSKGDFNFTDQYNLIIDEDEFFIENNGWEREIAPHLVELTYCKKCLKHHNKQLKDHTK